MRVLLLALSFAGAASVALAAADSTPPPELEAARKALAAAVKAQDLKAIVALSRFPLTFSGYEAPDQISEVDFLSDKNLFDGLFFQGDEPPEVSYKDKKGKYQAQTGVTLPKI